MKKKNGKICYEKYSLSVKQCLFSILLGMLGGSFVVLIFYRSIWAILLACMVGSSVLPMYYRRQLIQKRKKQLSEEFKEALYSLIVSLRAGRSLEGAFAAALEDMDEKMTPYIYREWKEIVKQLQVGFLVEDGLKDLGERSGIKEIQSFARMIEICKRSEGDIVRVMENTIQLLQERMEIQMELKVLLAKKKTEQKILTAMPFGVIGLLLLLSPDYLEPLYQSLQGRIVMTVCMGLMLLSYLMSRKIASIAL